jgi:ATP-dependent Clp protease ATP-binding subunit ClpC
MDDGVLTDGKGRTVNFKNTILVMTSNIGSQNILAMSRMSDGQISNSEVADMVKQELEQTMKPELLNRIDEIIVFNPLKYEDLKEIARNIIADISRRASEDRNIRLTVTENVAEMVTRQGYVASFGARPIKRAAKRYLEDTMAEAIMQEFIQEGDQVTVDLADQDSVSITRMSANGAGVKSMRVAVEGDAGIGSSSGQRWERLYGPAPSLDDDEGLPKETTGFR